MKSLTKRDFRTRYNRPLCAVTLEDHPMKALLTALTLVGISLAPIGARADEADIRATYKDFAVAQNARDLNKVGALLLNSPRFLWVSDGQSVWGREATLARMASFQEAPVWRVEPDLAKAVAVEIDQNAGFLHLPLQLVIGARESPDRLRFLVSVLCVRTMRAGVSLRFSPLRETGLAAAHGTGRLSSSSRRCRNRSAGTMSSEWQLSTVFSSKAGHSAYGHFPPPGCFAPILPVRVA